MYWSFLDEFWRALDSGNMPPYHFIECAKLLAWGGYLATFYTHREGKDIYVLVLHWDFERIGCNPKHVQSSWSVVQEGFVSELCETGVWIAKLFIWSLWWLLKKKHISHVIRAICSCHFCPPFPERFSAKGEHELTSNISLFPRWELPLVLQAPSKDLWRVY